jgi:arylsulfatase A-like enzyme
VYTGGTRSPSTAATTGDRDVPIVVYAPGVRSGVSERWVETTSVAPTILRLLGLDPRDLEAVREEGTPVLPGIR